MSLISKATRAATRFLRTEKGQQVSRQVMDKAGKIASDKLGKGKNPSGTTPGGPGDPANPDPITRPGTQPVTNPDPVTQPDPEYVPEPTTPPERKDQP